MRTIEADDAEARFDELLAEVETGETITITRHGVPIARFEPVRADVQDNTAAIEALHQFRREHRLTSGDGVTTRDLIEEDQDRRTLS